MSSTVKIATSTEPKPPKQPAKAAKDTAKPAKKAKKPSIDERIAKAVADGIAAQPKKDPEIATPRQEPKQDTPLFVRKDEPKQPLRTDPPASGTNWPLVAAIVLALGLAVGGGLIAYGLLNQPGQQNAGAGVGIRKSDAAVYKEFADDCAKERGTIYDNWPGLLPGQKHCNRQATWSVDPR